MNFDEVGGTYGTYMRKGKCMVLVGKSEGKRPIG